MKLLEFLIFVSKREKYQRELLSDTRVQGIRFMEKGFACTRFRDWTVLINA